MDKKVSLPRNDQETSKDEIKKTQDCHIEKTVEKQSNSGPSSERVLNEKTPKDGKHSLAERAPSPATKRDSVSKSKDDSEVPSKIVEVLNKLPAKPSLELSPKNDKVPVYSTTPNASTTPGRSKINRKLPKLQLNDVVGRKHLDAPQLDKGTEGGFNTVPKLSSYSLDNCSASPKNEPKFCATVKELKKMNASINEVVEGEEDAVDIDENMADKGKLQCTESMDKIKMAGPRIAFIDQGYQV